MKLVKSQFKTQSISTSRCLSAIKSKPKTFARFSYFIQVGSMLQMKNKEFTFSLYIHLVTSFATLDETGEMTQAKLKVIYCLSM